MKIGLEIHGYIQTQEKLFCNCKAEHGLKIVKPNTNICPICTAQPGLKPMLPNSEAIKKILQIALILNCKINEQFAFQRKHYNWPDLPKGFQNTVSGTYAKHIGEKGRFLDINITEVHLEEDPAAWDPETGEIDYNRSGIPLVEIVTDPDFKSVEQVIEWLKQLLITLDYIKAIDKDLGIKADVNISFPEMKGERVEIKNVNSLNNIKLAIEYEQKRQLQKGDIAKIQETRRYDPKKNITVRMRTKEQAQDYRFISEPDLPVIKLKKERIELLKKQLPETPQEKLKKLIKTYKIGETSAEILSKNLEIVEFFEKVISGGKVQAKLAVRWVTEELFSVLNYNKKSLDEIDLDVNHFIELLELVEKKTITELKAKDILRSWKQSSSSPKVKGQETISNTNEIKTIAKQIIKENSKAVNDFKNGEDKALNFLIGQLMQKTNRRADFKTSRIVLEELILDGDQKLKNN